MFLAFWLPAIEWTCWNDCGCVKKTQVEFTGNCFPFFATCIQLSCWSIVIRIVVKISKKKKKKRNFSASCAKMTFGVARSVRYKDTNLQRNLMKFQELLSFLPYAWVNLWFFIRFFVIFFLFFVPFRNKLTHWHYQNCVNCYVYVQRTRARCQHFAPKHTIYWEPAI